MKLIRVIGAVALAAGTSLLLAAPASATEPETVCGPWTASIFEGSDGPAAGADAVTVNAAGTEATLEKPAPGTGVEYLRKGLDLVGPLTITVAVDASADEAASGAVRIFGYASATPNTMTDAPTYGAPHPDDTGAVATGLNSPLTLVLGPGEELGALGFTYDSSNPSAGAVTFGPASIGNQPISFKACPEPEEEPSATPPATRPPTKAPTAKPSELPLTGPGDGINPLAILLPIGAVLVLGGVGFMLVRRNRHRFVA